MPRLTSSTRTATAADVLGPLLRRGVLDYRAREVEVRLGRPDAVRSFRVSTRRLRSLVASFRSLLDPRICKTLDGELQETARIVGGARDAQVIQRRLESLLGEEPDSRAVAEVRAQLTDQLARAYEESWAQAIDHFDGQRYDSLTRMLDGFADLPPWTPAAQEPAGEVFVAVLRKEWARLLRKGRRVQMLEAGPVRDGHLHEVRKAAKCVREVAEAQASISGRKVRRLGKRANRLQALLGEHHDLVVTGLLLEGALADRGGADDVLARLQAREAAAVEQLYDDFVRTFEEADRKPLRAWMS